MNGPVQNDLPKQPAAAPRTPKSPAPSAPKSPNSSAPKTPVVNGNQAPKEPRGRSPNASARVATEKLRQEAAALQKRVAQFRSENQGLKSKVKRLEDDCARKSRQLDKLAQTAKDALKQKCARLEMQLKEKEDKLKKLQAIQRRSSETATPEKLHPAKSRLTSSQPRGSSAELVKLREQMDRISQENRRLSFQLKEKEQEIRRLKSQLQPAAPAKTPVKALTRTPTKTPPKTPPVAQPWKWPEASQFEPSRVGCHRTTQERRNGQALKHLQRHPRSPAARRQNRDVRNHGRVEVDTPEQQAAAVVGKQKQ
ncbi:uncharacterized protein LOC119399752 isoform X2 [Rhipicephalus sanguineus]|uniref:uncharacterized protein LOC119399752 isoform X2 n=1 Tax=Rhipicephalus sanguineus TaxID=34632 RepID=UPI0020C31281|nr:uncharacterized protein LOC119399752 isoform X2 [Rhipicephalus sanguineus]